MTVPWTGDELEQIFHVALEQGDPQGVVAALTVMATIDLPRCERLHRHLTTALDVANALGSRT